MCGVRSVASRTRLLHVIHLEDTGYVENFTNNIHLYVRNILITLHCHILVCHESIKKYLPYYVIFNFILLISTHVPTHLYTDRQMDRLYH